MLWIDRDLTGDLGQHPHPPPQRLVVPIASLLAAPCVGACPPSKLTSDTCGSPTILEVTTRTSLLGPPLPGFCFEDLASLFLSFLSALEIETPENCLTVFEVHIRGLDYHRHGFIIKVFWHFQL